MNGENRPLEVTDEPVEFEKRLVQIQDIVRKLSMNLEYGIKHSLKKN